MYLERSWDGEAWPTLTIEFFCFNFAVGTEDPNRQDCLVTIRFGGLLNVKFDGFNHQNAINGLIMTDTWSENLNRQMFDILCINGRYGIEQILVGQDKNRNLVVVGKIEGVRHRFRELLKRARSKDCP